MSPAAKLHLGPKRRIALIYNAFEESSQESRTDHGGMWHLRQLVRSMARALRRLGHKVDLVPLADDLAAFQRRLLRLAPDVVFNQYDDVVHGALYEMRVATLVRMMGFPMTGSPALGLGLSRYKYMCASLLQGAGIPIPPYTRCWSASATSTATSGSSRSSCSPARSTRASGWTAIRSCPARRRCARRCGPSSPTYRQPALVQRFLPGREFNVGIVGGKRPRVLPLAEVDYSRLPPDIPPIMSYAAKWMERSTEYQKIRVICPAAVEPELAATIGDTAVRAFRAVGGWGYGRVDIRLDEDNVPARAGGQLQSAAGGRGGAGPVGEDGRDRATRSCCS